jgi:hypothetical protein
MATTNFSTVLSEIAAERTAQVEKGFSADADDHWTQNDWISFVNAYTGRAAQYVVRNQSEGNKFRNMMLKAAAVAVAAIEAHDRKVGATKAA